MNTAERLIEVMNILRQQQSSSVSELASRLNVTMETIRRDIRHLEKNGNVVKMHGSVRLPDALLEPSYKKRINMHAQVKQQIGRQAAGLVQDGMTVFIDCGSTSFWLARALHQPKGLQIVTNSLDITSEVLGRNDWRCVFVGGQMDTDYRAALDQEAISQARRFAPDLLFLSISALDAQRGCLDLNLQEADFKRSLLKLARKTVILADSSKFNKAGAVHMADFADIDLLVSDQAPEGELAVALETAGVEVLIAE
ncbi:DeoR/GlpR family DNA-binding transcription regulator [Bowmanella denitrificans]|uniref:DeoR/GlpR family DNA-binding transcription regulator n=1 Tax=Bowmanella denitrificans TaxID=366582 RepID=UPI0015595E4C|nr:DeoR/GlpR family DNA-binding transcription regulator [Bowmanella denitrificans]